MARPPGHGFAAAHHFVDGVSTARSDAGCGRAHRARHRQRVDLGSATTGGRPRPARLDDWPLHTVRHRRSITRDKQIAKSWNYTEYFPLNWHAVADYQAAHTALFGRYPSFQRLMQDARVEDERLVYDR